MTKTTLDTWEGWSRNRGEKVAWEVKFDQVSQTYDIFHKFNDDIYDKFNDDIYDKFNDDIYDGYLWWKVGQTSERRWVNLTNVAVRELKIYQINSFIHNKFQCN